MRTVMWEWNVRALDFDRQVEATVAAGFDILTLPFRKYCAFTADGRSAEDLVAIAADRGITLDFLDGMSGWAPVRYPDGADAFLREALDFGPDEAFALCRRTGMIRIVAIAGFASGQVPHDVLVESFGAFCDRAADLGIRVDLEPMPMMGLPRLADAWAIVRDADRPNSGVLFDSWHFMRGGADWDLLRSIPRGRIRNAQIVDGLAEPPSPDLWEDAMHHREFPGLGVLPLDRMLTILRDTQDLESVGPEALSDRVDALAPAELGRQASETLHAALARNGLRAPPAA
jgi:sugar phosphate isomerase/epimerase